MKDDIRNMNIAIISIVIKLSGCSRDRYIDDNPSIKYLTLRDNILLEYMSKIFVQCVR